MRGIFHKTRMPRVFAAESYIDPNASLILLHTSQAAGSELFNFLVFHSRLAGTGERQKNNADQTGPDANGHGAGPA